MFHVLSIGFGMYAQWIQSRIQFARAVTLEFPVNDRKMSHSLWDRVTHSIDETKSGLPTPGPPCSRKQNYGDTSNRMK